ncbi:DNA-3-methyladenine glycosylase 2 family protein [Actinomadura scrupuli]|uniref:DNA-3-methyladenine glycosylase 2 family protein n=1 Tax=Actinomadura scrupuli TaxID=559629 RepID=UPI003D98EC27
MLDFDSCYLAVSSRDARFDGRFYTGVTSTGIYCRPICPARTPARRNVRFYPDASAAEAAGFRPCKRCRPESSPGSPEWDVRGDLVGRALRLIDDGVVDETGVRGLASRLAVTERHLHRLFVAEIGAAPLMVARTRRLQFARRLLRETGMPVTDVAFASGFGSVRQFNASMREAYGLAPSELRNGAGRPPGLVLRLAFRKPYDSAGLLALLSAQAVPGVESVTSGRYLRTVPGGTIELVPHDDHVLLRASITAGSRRGEGSRAVDSRPGAGLRGLAGMVARCRRLFDLDADPYAVNQVLGADPLLAGLVRARPGLRVPGAYDGFEAAVRAVLGRQASAAGARVLLGRVVARCGAPAADPAPGDATFAGADRTLTHVFPSAAAVAEADLGGLGLSEGRTRALHALATAVASGELDLDGGADPAETTAKLLALPGIGPSAVSAIRMRALRDPDAFPAADPVLHRALDRLGTDLAHTEAWRPWRAYAAAHLWAAEPDAAS